MMMLAGERAVSAAFILFFSFDFGRGIPQPIKGKRKSDCGRESRKVTG
jgi:hypothetical protein